MVGPATGFWVIRKDTEHSVSNSDTEPFPANDHEITGYVNW